MENEFTITFASDNDDEAALVQTSYMKAYLAEHGIANNQSRKKVGQDEAGGELLPILTIVAPLVASVGTELIKAIAGWLKTRANARTGNLKVKISNTAGEQVELDVSNFSESETELLKKFGEHFSAVT